MACQLFLYCLKGTIMITIFRKNKFHFNLLSGAMVFAFSLISTLPAQADQTDKAANLKSQKLAHGLHMLTGKGGNVGVLVGKKHTLVIDNQFADMAPKLIKKIKKLSKRRDIEFLINTH